MGVSDKLRFVAVTLAEPTKDQIKRSWRPLPHHPTTHSFIHPLSHQVAAGQVNYELSGSAAGWVEHQTLCTAGRIR